MFKLLQTNLLLRGNWVCLISIGVQRSGEQLFLVNVVGDMNAGHIVSRERAKSRNKTDSIINAY